MLSVHPFSKATILLGCALLGMSLALGGWFYRLTAVEQALSPGEDSFGVAALAMFWVPPILATGAAGLLCLFFGVTIAAIVHLRRESRID